MKINLLLFLSFSLLLSCQSSRAPSSLDFQSENLSSYATTHINGKIQFKRRIGRSGKFTPRNCEFSYEKGSKETPDGSKTFSYEEFIIGYEGMDETGELIYSSFSYINTNKMLNLDEGFEDRPIRSLIDSDNLKDATVSYTFGVGLTPILKLSHTDEYQRGKSVFFSPKNRRKVYVTLKLDKSAQGNTPVPSEMNLTIEESSFSKNGNGYVAPKEVVNLTCSNFSKI